MRVAAVATLVCVMAFALTPVLAERDPRSARASGIRLVPASAEPVWQWLRRETAPNDRFVGRDSRFFFARSSTRVTPRSDHFRGLPEAWVPHPGGTRFRFTVGSDNWSVRADARRRVVFYEESCCSFGRKVLATYASAPPASVDRADLRAIVAASGIRIGDSPGRVFRLLGTPVRRLTSPASRRWAVAYSHPLYPGAAKNHGMGWTCVEERTAVFEANRLVAYEITSGC